MNYVNQQWLDYIWGSVGGDIDYPDLLLRDMKSSKNFNTLIRKYLKPSFDSFPLEVLQLIKGTWRFAISKYDNEILKKAFESNLPPFELPNYPREFYIKVWEALFSNESWHIEEDEIFLEINDSQLNPWEWTEKSKS